ncbi:MAG: hypothetical protein R3E76_14800 [Planctomycetota bacterium]
MKRIWKEVFAFLATFGPALLAVVLETLQRKQKLNDDDETGGG